MEMNKILYELILKMAAGKKLYRYIMCFYIYIYFLHIFLGKPEISCREVKTINVLTLIYCCKDRPGAYCIKYRRQIFGKILKLRLAYFYH